MRRSVVLVSLALFLFFFATISDATPVDLATNGSFESNNVGLFAYLYAGSVTASPWVFTGGSGVQSNGSAWGFASAPDGSYTAFLQNTSEISQNVSGLTVGQTYTLSFDLAQRPSPYQQNPVSIYVGGVLLSTLTPPSTAWTIYSVGFLATNTTEQIKFSTANSTGDHDTGLDKVAIIATPEPGTLILLGSGLVGFGVKLRSRLRG